MKKFADRELSPFTRGRKTKVQIVVVALLALCPALTHASTVRVSILSILQPTKLTVTLRQPDRTLLRADAWNTPIAANAPVTITLHNNLLETNQGPASPALQLKCEEACVVELEVPNKIKRTYTGDFMLRSSASAISIVLQSSEERLLASILSSEMGEHREPEALQAFAILARSFLRTGSRHPELGADFCDLTHCQVFQAHPPSPEALTAVRNTAGLILTYKQRPFRPFYSRSCGGQTARFEEVWKQPSPDYPFTSVKCPCNSPWETTLRKEELDALAGFSHSRIEQNQDGVALHAVANRVTYSLEQFRILAGRALGWKRIQSNDFVIQADGDGATIRGKGIGHRIGFCQTGSAILAQEGQEFQEILRHYFPNAEIRNQK